MNQRNEAPDVRRRYQYVFELREELTNTRKIAHEKLVISQRKNKLYDQKQKRRIFHKIKQVDCKDQYVTPCTPCIRIATIKEELGAEIMN